MSDKLSDFYKAISILKSLAVFLLKADVLRFGSFGQLLLNTDFNNVS